MTTDHKELLSDSEMCYVFKDRKDCTLVTRNQYGDGGIEIETLYAAFKQRLISEAVINPWPSDEVREKVLKMIDDVEKK